MHPDPRVLPADVEQAGEAIERFTEGMDPAAYTSDFRTQAAVERKFEIVGEALNILSSSNPELAKTGVSDTQDNRLPQPANLRLSNVTPERVWDYAKNHLPQLRQVAQSLLAELGLPEE